MANTASFEFNDTELSRIVERLAPQERETLPFGCALLDSSGALVELNRAFAALLGLDAAQALGKNLFCALLPCTQHPLFYGAFLQSQAPEPHGNPLSVCFEFAFQDARYPPLHAPLAVLVQLFAASAGVATEVGRGRGLGEVWLLLRESSHEVAPQLLRPMQAPQAPQAPRAHWLDAIYIEMA